MTAPVDRTKNSWRRHWRIWYSNWCILCSDLNQVYQHLGPWTDTSEDTYIEVSPQRFDSWRVPQSASSYPWDARSSILRLKIDRWLWSHQNGICVCTHDLPSVWGITSPNASFTSTQISGNIKGINLVKVPRMTGAWKVLKIIEDPKVDGPCRSWTKTPECLNFNKWLMENSHLLESPFGTAPYLTPSWYPPSKFGLRLLQAKMSSLALWISVRTMKRKLLSPCYTRMINVWSNSIPLLCAFHWAWFVIPLQGTLMSWRTTSKGMSSQPSGCERAK